MTQRKKVLWLIKGLGLGGAEKLFVLSLPHMDHARYEYEVAYLLPWKDALVDEIESHGVRVTCLNHRKTFDPRGYYKVATLLRDRKPDLLHMHLPYAALMGRVASRFADVPASIYTEHNVFERYHPLMAFAHSKSYSMNDGAIFVSDAVRKSVLERCKNTGGLQLKTIHNGIDLDLIDSLQVDRAGIRNELGVPLHDQMVTTVASFTPKKRHEDLLRAAKIVLADRPNVSFVLGGDGPLRERIQQLARELGIDQKVFFTGVRHDAIGIVAAGDLFVLPSQYEALGIALLEAMALEKPTIATNVGGIPEVIDHGTDGILIPPLDHDYLAVTMRMILDDPDLADRLAKAGRARVERQFDIREMVRKTERFYDEVMQAQGVS